MFGVDEMIFQVKLKNASVKCNVLIKGKQTTPLS